MGSSLLRFNHTVQDLPDPIRLQGSISLPEMRTRSQPRAPSKCWKLHRVVPSSEVCSLCHQSGAQSSASSDCISCCVCHRRFHKACLSGVECCIGVSSFIAMSALELVTDRFVLLNFILLHSSLGFQ